MRVKRTKLLLSLLTCVAIAIGVDQASGAIVPFTTRTSFDATLPGATIEGWESYAAGTTFANGSTVNGITYNSSTNIAVVTNQFRNTTTPNSLGRTETVPGFDFFAAADTITFGFVTPIFAFGIDINTFAVNAGSYQATTNLGDIALSGFGPFPGFTTGQFVGFTSDTQISSVIIGLGPLADTTANNSYTLDTMRRTVTRTATVPEPSALLLFSSGLAGLVGTARRLQRRK